MSDPAPLQPPAPPQTLPVSVVDLWSVLDAIVEATPFLEALRLPPDAPPAFLLDAERRHGQGPLRPSRFDNRSLSFPTDFPSANFLLARGLRRAILLQPGVAKPQPDLAHTLYRWQEAGIELAAQALDAADSAAPLHLARPSGFRNLLYVFFQSMGLRRNHLGGFGGTIPEPSSSSVG
jgi:hypothetical protein